MSRNLRRVVTATAIVSMLVTACGGGNDAGDGTASGTPTSSSPTTGPPTTGPPADDSPGGQHGSGTDDDGHENPPPFPADTRPDTADASAGAMVTVTDIRIGRHDHFDRVVFEVAGTGTPGWDVRYVDAAASQGSGAPIDVTGDAILQVTLTGVGYPTETGVQEWSGPDRLSVHDTEVVTEVVWDTTFEGTSVAFVGATHTVPFRVYLLTAPARVVLEVADDS